MSIVMSPLSRFYTLEFMFPKLSIFHYFNGAFHELEILMKFPIGKEIPFGGHHRPKTRVC